MATFTKCPKCPGHLSSAKTNLGANYDWCNLCKGMWLKAPDLLKIFGDKVETKLLQELRIERALPTVFPCPSCQAPLKVGKVESSDLEIEECSHCQSYFFDAQELNKLYRILDEPALPKAKNLEIEPENVVELDSKCPVCKDQPLYGSKDDPKAFQGCLQCDGFLTTVETLQKLLKRSLFSAMMFTYHSGQGDYATCRHCKTAQEVHNKACMKCGRTMLRVNCLPCNGRMSEYQLGDTIIERCQICNQVWLDYGEFESLVTALPDVKKRYEEEKRRLELKMVENKAAAHYYSLSIGLTQRQYQLYFAFGMAGVARHLLSSKLSDYL